MFSEKEKDLFQQILQDQAQVETKVMSLLSKEPFSQESKKNVPKQKQQQSLAEKIEKFKIFE
jgi:hypothetical protein